MALKFKTSGESVTDNGKKILVYGDSGVGKTPLIETLDSPFIMDVEGGLLSLQNKDLPVGEVRTVDDLDDLMDWLCGSTEADQFASIAIDSLTEIVEMILNSKMKATKNGMKAYGDAGKDIQDFLFRLLEHVHKDIYVIAKQTFDSDIGMYVPSMPWSKIQNSIRYKFDQILALRIFTDEDGETFSGLMCKTDGTWKVRDRSGILDQIEEPHLGKLIAKIKGGK